MIKKVKYLAFFTLFLRKISVFKVFVNDFEGFDDYF